jgi:hypothetical protein
VATKPTGPARRARRARRTASGSLLSGIRGPWICAAAYFMLLAAGTALLVGRGDSSSVSQAVLDSKEDVAEDLARALRVELSSSIAELKNAAATLAISPADAAATLPALRQADREWRGLAVVDSVTGRLLATDGEHVALAELQRSDRSHPTLSLVEPPSGQLRVLLAVPVPHANDQPRLLVASSAPPLHPMDNPEPLNRSVYIVDQRGHVIDRSDQAATDARTETLIEQAAGQAHAGDAGTLLDRRTSSNQVVSFAPVANDGPASRLRLAVVTISTVGTDSSVAGDRLLGLGAGASLAALALFGFATIYTVVIRPVRHLRREAQRLAENQVRRPVIVPRHSAEAHRIGLVLETMRRKLGGPGDPHDGEVRPPKFAVSSRFLVFVVAAALSGWSLAVPVAAAQYPPAGAPDAVVADQRIRVATVADTVRTGIEEGLADLGLLAGRYAGQSQKRQRALLADEIRTQKQYRSLYVVDQRGVVLASAGSDPLRSPGPPPTGIGVVQANQRGRTPLLIGHVPLQSGRVLIAEYSARFLSRLVGNNHLGDVWLTDSRDHMVGSNRGFRAFAELADLWLQVAAEKARTSKTVAQVHNAGREPVLRFAAPVGPSGPAAELNWTVVSRLAVSRLALPTYDLQRHAKLVGMLGLTGTVLLYGWMHVLVVRRLRLLAESNDSLATGKRDPTVYPGRQDEIGVIVRKLDQLHLAVVARKRAFGFAHGEPTRAAITHPQARPQNPPTPRPAPAARAGNPRSVRQSAHELGGV